MPRRSKGPRLYLRAGRVDARSGRPLPALYYIRDGAREVGTGCGPDRLRGAEEALARYIAGKWTPPAATGPGGSRDPAEVLIADVLALYARERAPRTADPVSVAGRIRKLLTWWGERTLADVKRSTCQAYVEHRILQPRAAARTAKARERKITPMGARRELEDLSAAINYWHGEHTLSAVPVVWMPEKPESQRDALTRSQAAALLMAARGYRLVQKGRSARWERLPAATRVRRAHLRRFLLIGLYTGTRPGVIQKLLWEESPRQAWVDFGHGTIWRRGRGERDQKTKRRPVVKLPGQLLAHLGRWRRIDAARDARALEAAKRKGEEAPAPINSVVHYLGRPIADRVDKAFAACVADAGLPAGITPHWMRHTAATWLMEAGADLWDAAGYMGMTVETLERFYGHHRPDYQAGIAGSRRRR
jgi:integrase